MNSGVASSHPLSTFAGKEVLSNGGNAYDALLAVSSCLVVVQPHLNGLGSDLFATIKDNNYYSINASGYAAEKATLDFFKSKGYDKIPERGHFSSFSIPGMVSAWEIISEKINLNLYEDFKRAIQFAKDGFVPSEKLKKSINLMKGDYDFENIYKSSNNILYQKDLANTLNELVKTKFYSFYHGKIAKAIDKDMVNKGGLIRFSDLDKYKAEIKNPLKIKYRNYDIYTNPPVSQGLTALSWFNLLNNYDLKSMNKDDYYDTLIKTMYDAYNIRKNYVYDGSIINDVKELKPDKSINNDKKDNISDTTAYSIYDGNIEISAIQSNYMGFGSGHTIHGTGINMNNRGSYFSLNKDNKNVLKPFKKTFHTLMSTIASGNNDIIFGSMGGDIQPEVNVQVLSRIIDLDYDIQNAISYPRFAYPASIYSDSDIYYEKSLNLVKYKIVDDLNDMMGHAHGITIGNDNVKEGFDPRGDGLIEYNLKEYFK